MTRFCSVAEQSSTVYPGHVLCICTSAGEYLSWAHNLSVVNSKHGGGHNSLLRVDFGPRRYNPRNGMIRSWNTNCLFLVTSLMLQARAAVQECDWTTMMWLSLASSGRELGKVCLLFVRPSFFPYVWRRDKQKHFVFCRIPSKTERQHNVHVSRLCCLLWGKEVLVSMMHLGEVKP